MRDARISPIYEGTNGIQAMDLLGRKLVRDNGEAMAALIAIMRRELAAIGAGGFADLANGVTAGVDALEQATASQIARFGVNAPAASAAAVDYLELAGRVVSAWLLAKGAAAAKDWAGDDAQFAETRIAIARFFTARLLPPAIALAGILGDGADAVLAFPEAAA
jgi:hypothetical protein